MADNFGLKIGLEGEKEFKKALADINSSFKVLGSEMKLVSSQFDKNDNSVQALTARNEVLNKEIDAQKQKIETLRAALQNAAESFGENDKRTQNWQIQLNNAEAALNGMERELDDNNKALADAESGFDGAGKEADDFGKEVEDAGKQSDDAGSKMSKLGDVAKKVGKAMAAAMAAIGAAAIAAGKQIWDMANQTAEAGDAIDKTSQKIGISAESYQEWDYVFQRCGADVNGLQTGMKKLSGVITDAASGSASAADKLAAVGLSIEDLNGKSQDEQLSIVIAALQNMESGAERTAAANDLLGKSAVDMAAVLNMSAEETQAWLFTEPDRYHRLTDTYETGCFRNAVINTNLNIEDQLNKIGVFTVSFSCQPFKYLSSGQTAVTFTNGGGTAQLKNPTPFTSKPLIRINGSGDGTLTVANSGGVTRLQIEGINSYLYCDSEQMNFYKGAASMNEAVTADRFPVLTAGLNTFVFSGGITSIAVTPRWVTL